MDLRQRGDPERVVCHGPGARDPGGNPYTEQTMEVWIDPCADEVWMFRAGERYIARLLLADGPAVRAS